MVGEFLSWQTYPLNALNRRARILLSQDAAAAVAAANVAAA